MISVECFCSLRTLQSNLHVDTFSGEYHFPNDSRICEGRKKNHQAHIWLLYNFSRRTIRKFALMEACDRWCLLLPTQSSAHSFPFLKFQLNPYFGEVVWKAFSENFLQSIHGIMPSIWVSKNLVLNGIEVAILAAPPSFCKISLYSSESSYKRYDVPTISYVYVHRSLGVTTFQKCFSAESN